MERILVNWYSFKKGFLLIIFLVFLFFAAKSGKEIAAYYRFSKKISCEFKNAEVVALKDYFIMGTFSYENKELKALMAGPYPNKFIAEKDLAKIHSGNYSLWLDPKNDKALLTKRFPKKGVISSFILLGIIVYFQFLFRDGKKVYD